MYMFELKVSFTECSQGTLVRESGGFGQTGEHGSFKLNRHDGNKVLAVFKIGQQV